MGGSVADNPYELNLGLGASRGLTSGNTTNNPFSPNELERILRPFDRDAASLPGRLTSLISSAIQNRHLLTTESWDVPCQSRPSAAQSLVEAIMAQGVTQGQLITLLPPELLAGLKMNLNRPFGNGRDDNSIGDPGYGVVDESEPAESGEQVTFNSSTGTVNVNVLYDATGALATNALQARQLYARYMYVLAMLLCRDGIKTQLGNLGLPNSDPAVARFIAQWAINVVDFMDRDSIMTPFPFDETPWDGWNEPPMTDITHVVWGCERPELLITETLAIHDRRTEDLDSDSSGKTTTDIPNPDDDFDQRKKPEGSLFVELYNPWTSMEPTPGELYGIRSGIEGIDLAKRASDGSPIWRMLIVEGSQYQQDPDETVSITGEHRCVYFTDPGTLSLGDGCTVNSRYYPNPSDTHAVVNPIPPGRYAVIGPGTYDANLNGYVTFLGRRTVDPPQNDPDPATSRHIILRPEQFQAKTPFRSNSTAVEPTDNQIQNIISIAVNYPRRVSISEPANGSYYPDYPPGLTYYNPTIDRPPDYDRSDYIAQYVRNIGTNSRVLVIHLQRLANPLMPYHADTNPYRTVDSMPIDLISFNGWADDASEVGRGWLTNGTTMTETHQRGETNIASDGINNIWIQRLAAKPLQGSLANTPAYIFGYSLHHTLGYLNTPFEPRETSGNYVGDPQQTPFPWLNWNNRPFVDACELLLVPNQKCSRLLNTAFTPTPTIQYGSFGIAAPGTDTYANFNEPYPHLLNFFHSGAPGGNNDAYLHRLLEYVYVPSRFVGTEIQANPTAASTPPTLPDGQHCFHPPFNLISNYRDPGRINLNTIYDPSVFNGLANGFPYPTETGQTIWERFVTSRRGTLAPTASDILWNDPSNPLPTEFAQPFRSFGSATMIPPVTGLDYNREISATLLRPDPINLAHPLFDYSSTVYVNNTDRNPFFRYQGLERLQNLVTTRSNVYAVWITVGYFEVKPWPGGIDPAHLDGYQLGQELGMDTGEIQRHRAFYMIDRTIPVGFVRGQDLNVEKAIILKRFIE
jgi:hypothetical protein